MTPPVQPNGERLEFLIVVIDTGGLSHTDTVSIDVQDNGIEVFPDDVLPTPSATGKNIAIKIVENQEDLLAALRNLLQNIEQRENFSKAAKNFVLNKASTCEKILERVD